MGLTLSQINAMDRSAFVEVLGGCFEKSPWIASAVWADRPFDSVEALFSRMVQVVEDGGEERLLELLRVHPDLAARLDEQAALTGESLAEQRAAGLLDLAPDRALEMRRLIAHYRDRFGFPFVICARLNDAGKIFTELEERTGNAVSEERRAAWHEVRRIAALRLEDLLPESGTP